MTLRYINWLTISTDWLGPTQTSNFFLDFWQSFNSITVNLSCLEGFQKWGRLMGDNLGKMAKKCMKITKLTFLVQISEKGHGGTNFSASRATH